MRVYSGHMVNTLSGMNGEGLGPTRFLSFFIEVSEIELHEVDEPNFVANLFDADLLAAEHST